MYEILLHPDAQKVYAKADKALAKKIAMSKKNMVSTGIFEGATGGVVLWGRCKSFGSQ